MSIRENIAEIRRRIDEAARETGRTGADITLVGASKMNDAAACQEAIAAGIDVLGENRVQEMVTKLAENAYDGAPLHFIGHQKRDQFCRTISDNDMLRRAAGIESNCFFQIRIISVRITADDIQMSSEIFFYLPG